MGVATFAYSHSVGMKQEMSQLDETVIVHEDKQGDCECNVLHDIRYATQPTLLIRWSSQTWVDSTPVRVYWSMGPYHTPVLSDHHRPPAHP
jgi:hypothetical protein